MTTMRIEITRNRHGNLWHCTAFVKHPDFLNEAVTHASYGTLKSALWHLMMECVDSGYELLLVSLNDKDLPFDQVWGIVYKALVGGPSAYNLPKIKKLLEV